MANKEGPVTRDVIVIGASAGGVEALAALVRDLPPDLPAAVFVVLHLAPQATSVLPRILTRAGDLPAVHPPDGAPIRAGQIYVAPPDRHLTLEPGRVRVQAGPKENRHRPAVDPLFRTAARVYGPRVIAVVLTGSGDDGTAGLDEVRLRGGTAVIQSPEEAFCAGMPQSALEFVGADYVAPLAEIGPLLSRLAREPLPFRVEGNPHPPEATAVRTEPEPSEPIGTPGGVALPETGARSVPGPEEGFTCPHCHGHLWEVHQGRLLGFRCRVGHSFSADSLLQEKYEGLESTLWAAVNALQESAALAHRLANRSRERGHDLTARRLGDRAQTAEEHARMLRQLLVSASYHVATDEEDAAVESRVLETTAGHQAESGPPLTPTN